MVPLGLVDQSRVRSPAKPPLQRHQNYPVAPRAAVNITKLFEVQTLLAHRRGSAAKLSYRAIKMLSAGIRLSAGFAGTQGGSASRPGTARQWPQAWRKGPWLKEMGPGGCQSWCGDTQSPSHLHRGFRPHT